MKKKVLFFLPGGIGGAERMTVTIAKMLPKEDFDIKFVIVDKTRGNIEKFIPDRYKVQYMKVINIWDFVTFRLIRLMRKEKPDVVFCSTMYMSVRVLLAAHITGGIKTIIRNCNYWSTLRKDQMLLCKWTYRYADKIIAQQKEMEDEIVDYLPYTKGRVITLQNPLDTDTIGRKAKEPSPFTIADSINYVSVARMHPQKGQDLLVKSFNIICQKNKNMHLYLVGTYNEDDSFYKSIKEFVENHQLSDHVHFVGFDSNPYRWVKHASCFVLPSRIEGLPNALIEAQYMGTVSVATRSIPVIDRIIEDGVNGYKVDVDDVEALANAMMKAPELGLVKMTYKPAQKEDFINLFR